MCNPRTVSMAAAILFVLAPEPALAEGKRTSSLAWVRLDGSESCIAAPALARSVESRLGRKVFVSASEADITLEGTIGRAPDVGFLAHLRVTAKDGKVLGSRDVETRAASCDAIDEKLSLVISLLIDPDASLANEEAPTPTAAAPTIIERERIVFVHDEPRDVVVPWRFELTLAAMGTLGLQPDLGLAFAPSVLLTPPRFWGIRVGGGIAAPTSTEARSGARAEASLTYGSAALCPLHAASERFDAIACGGALLGALRGRGIGFDTTTTTSSLVAGPLALGRAALKLGGPFIGSVALTLVVPLAQAEIGYHSASDSNALFRTAAIAGMAELGIGLRLP